MFRVGGMKELVVEAFHFVPQWIILCFRDILLNDLFMVTGRLCHRFSKVHVNKLTCVRTYQRRAKSQVIHLNKMKPLNITCCAKQPVRG